MAASNILCKSERGLVSIRSLNGAFEWYGSCAFVEALKKFRRFSVFIPNSIYCERGTGFIGRHQISKYKRYERTIYFKTKSKCFVENDRIYTVVKKTIRGSYFALTLPSRGSRRGLALPNKHIAPGISNWFQQFLNDQPTAGDFHVAYSKHTKPRP